jgi:hypothetical protein
MFGFLKRKKKKSYDERPAAGCDTLGASHAVLGVPHDEMPPVIEEDGYFLNDRDIKVIVNACIFMVKRGGDEEIVAQIPETGSKLREKIELSPDDITVISTCLQAYNNEMSKLVTENQGTPVEIKLRNERVYFLTVIEKLTKYLTA